VHAVVLPLSTPAEQLVKYGAIIVSGGPQSVYDVKAPKFDPRVLALGKPILGICYGLQLINYVSGGSVQKGAVREDGQFLIDIENSPSCPLFHGLPQQVNVLLTHGDSVSTLAPDYRQIGMSADSGIVAAIQHKTLPIAAVQFHPEVDLTQHGLLMLQNFLFRIAKLPALYTPRSRQESAIAYIRGIVGDMAHVLMLVSGGVDSTVCAALLKAAIGAERVRAIHVDNGFMRSGESKGVSAALASVGLPITLVDASAQFYAATTTVDGITTPRLDECCTPELKRKIIGDTFVHVAQRAMSDLALFPKLVFLAQGTLRPDLIESASDLASSNAEVIKTHHNDTELVRALRKAGRVLEPLKDYHKDQVRALGQELGLPTDLVWRQPFPGPGLSVRIICGSKPSLPDHTEVKAIAAYSTGAIDARILPIRTVGVQGDSRSYSSLAALSLKSPTNLKILKNLKTLKSPIPGTVPIGNSPTHAVDSKRTEYSGAALHSAAGLFPVAKHDGDALPAPVAKHDRDAPAAPIPKHDGDASSAPVAKPDRDAPAAPVANPDGDAPTAAGAKPDGEAAAAAAAAGACAGVKRGEILALHGNAAARRALPDFSRLGIIPAVTFGGEGDGGKTDSAKSPLEDVPWATLFDIALQIPKRVHGINRVVFVFGEPLSESAQTTNGYTPTLLTPDAIAQLRAADAIVNAVMIKYSLSKTLSQVPVILFVRIPFSRYCCARLEPVLLLCLCCSLPILASLEGGASRSGPLSRMIS
jgi:GMP synthase (glutamine-hydrolysing)